MIIISGNMFVVFPFIRVLGVHGPCLLLKNETLFVVAYPTGLWKFLLQSPVKSEELVTEPLFYHDNIQVGNKTILHRRWIKKGVVTFLIFYMNMELSCALKNLIYGLDTDFVTYSGCVICRVVMYVFQFMPLAGCGGIHEAMTPALRRTMAVYFKVIVILVDIGTTLSKKKKTIYNIYIDKNLLTGIISALYNSRNTT